MTFKNITTPTPPSLQTSNIPLGLLIQIAFSNGIRNQISTDYRDYEMIKRAKVANSLARELHFMFQSSLGPAAIQYGNPGEPDRTFADGQNVSLAEYAAVLKTIDATIEIPYESFDRARKNPEKYGEPVQIEVESKMSAAKRRQAADLYADGTGVLGVVLSATDLSGTQTTVTLNLAGRGNVAFFEPGDIISVHQTNGAASATSLDTKWQVLGKDRDSDKVVLNRISGAGAKPSVGDLLYRAGQPTKPNLSGAVTDYGTVSEVIAGLDSLVANDGRVIHGITMSGVTSGTHYDAGGNPLDVKHIQRLMSNVKLAVGQDRYRWKMLTMAPESHATLIESRESDRRFQTIDDNKRGVKFFAYVHGNDVLECTESEFCPKNKIYCLPETKAGEKVLEYHGSDFETVKGQDMTDFHLKVKTGSYVNTMVSYLNAKGVLICKHPAAVGVIKGFTNS